MRHFDKKNNRNCLPLAVRLALAATLSMALLLSGCGGGAKGTETAPSSNAEKAASGTKTGDGENGQDAGKEAGQAGETTGQKGAEASGDVADLRHARMEIEGHGAVTLALDAGAAPVTVANFIKLVDSGFYDGLTFHRIMDGFMIQGGDPAGNGTGGSDETIVGEFASNGHENPISHRKGVLSMARAQDPNSASSQFFICVADSTFLDGQYAAFGYVTDGMDIVEQIAKDARPIDNNGTIPPQDQPVITSIRMTD